MRQKNKAIVRRIELDGKLVAYELFRGTYKNINLRIRGNGSIRVSADRRIPMERVDSFLLDKGKWIENALRRLNEAGGTFPDAEAPWREGGKIPILGRERTIQVSVGEKRRVVQDGDRLIVSVPAQSREEIRDAVKRMMERESQRTVVEMLEEVKPAFAAYGIPVPQIRFRYMVSRWGSCCPSTRTITFNKYLICVPKECIEYVIVHELAHFLELNHSPDFWAIVEKILPDWRARKQALLPYGSLLRSL